MGIYTCQQNMVRKHLDRFGSITKNDASAMRIGNVNEVVRQLRLRGIEIDTVVEKDGSGQKFCRWELRGYA